VRYGVVFFFSSRRRHTRLVSDWSSDVCSSDLLVGAGAQDRAVVAGSVELQVVGVECVDPAVGLDVDAVVLVPAAGPDRERVGVEIGRASCRGRGEGWGVGG